jgi:hypothetical protein
LAGLAAQQNFQQLVHQATRRLWVVYAKRPFAGPQQVLAYLSRYTHRVAISPKRLVALDSQNGSVSFSWKDYAEGSRRKIMTLPVGEFLRRFCLHFLPGRFVKIRHYGLQGNRQGPARLTQAWAALARESSSPATWQRDLNTPLPKAAPPRLCPFCGSQRLWLQAVESPVRRNPVLRLDSS